MSSRKIVAAWVAAPVWCVLASVLELRVIGTVLVIAILGVGTAMVARHGSRGPSAVRRAAFLVELGLLVITVAATIALGSQSGTRAVDPSVQVGSMLGAALMGVGLMVLLHAQKPESAVGALFEGILCVTALAFFAWAAAAHDGAPVGAVVHVLPLLIGGLVVWLAAQVATNCRGAHEELWLLTSAAAGLLMIQVVESTGLVSGGGVHHELTWLLRMWACTIAALAFLHPSIDAAAEPVITLPGSRGLERVVAPLGLTLVAPALFSLQALRHDPPPLTSVLGGSSVLALLVAVFLVRLVHEGARAEFRAHHDPLTGLPHRALFHDRLDVALSNAQRSGTCVGLMFLDLDRFKTINDSLGHTIGNQLLQRVGERLRSCVRDADTVGRAGGDEFTILLPDVSGAAECVDVAETILRAFDTPFAVGTRQLVTSTSIGIAVYPDDGTDADSLIKNADIAMYRAKANGRNLYQVYRSDMSARAQVKHSLERSLRRAIEGGELELHYQPKLDSRTYSVVGLEALARWRHPDLGFIPPSAFIPLAEETGLIGALGEWVLEESCTHLERWKRERRAGLPVAVNISAREFVEPGVDRRVADALHRHGLDPVALELELTESIFMHNLDAASKALFRLRDIGVRCSIDDFGTGYSGLTYLSELPIVSLKIDRSFVGKIGSTATGEQIVDAVINLARSLHMKVIAEGVETGTQARFLQSRGCDQMQGLLFYPPLAVNQLDGLLSGVGAGRPRPDPDADRGLLQAPPAGAPLDAVGELLAAVCRNEDIERIDDDRVAAVLACL